MTYNNYAKANVSSPSVFPKFINDIQNEEERAVWKGYYITEYKKEYENFENSCEGIKGTILGVSVFAALVFATKALLTAKLTTATIAASLIGLHVVIIPAAICVFIYYGCKSDQIDRDKRAIPQTFPLKFEVLYEQSKVAYQKAQVQAQAHAQAMQMQFPIPVYLPQH